MKKTMKRIVSLLFPLLTFGAVLLSAEDSESSVGSQNNEGVLTASALSDGSLWIVIAAVVVAAAVLAVILIRKKKKQ